MRQVKVTAASKVVQRIAIVACVAILGVGATACGSTGSNVTPGAPTPTVAKAPTTTPKSGGAGF
jgi:hypothetical protein